MKEDMANVFSQDGLLARVLGAAFHPRPGQAEMAQLVAEAIHGGQHAVIEAGTGTGKTFAYLVPITWHSKKAFISTANKTLQTQLIEKDLPLLQQALPQHFTFALLKGRSNYICNVRLSELLIKPTVTTDIAALQQLNFALVNRPDGDLDALAVDDRLRRDLVVTHEECLAESCRFYSECYYRCARMKAEASDVVVVNHALLARIALGQGISLREYVVVDEAHELARYMEDALAKQVTSTRIARVLHGGYAQKLVALSLLQRIEKQAEELFDQLYREIKRADETRLALTREDLIEHGRVLVGGLQLVAQSLERNSPEFDREDSETKAHFDLAVRRASNLASDLAAIFAAEDALWARYFELIGDGQQNTAILKFQPVVVREILHDGLFKRTATTICTSATLSVDQSFSYFRNEVGLLPDFRVLEKAIGSPFDYRRQALLYIPRHLIPPSYSTSKGQKSQEQARFTQDLQQEIGRLLGISQGRALVLFTNNRRMKECYDGVKSGVPYPCYIQGQLPKPQLIQIFREEISSVLFATRSFWSGIDMVGDTLSLVIVERPPYSSPSDPVYDKRKQIAAQGGLDAWETISIPQAALELKQGVGRLIRSETDRGVVAILDSRLIQKPYGKRILGSLPFSGYVSDLDKVRGFFEQTAKQAAPVSQVDEQKHGKPVPPPSQPVRPSPAIAPPIPTFPTLGGYRFIRQLGEGGFGIVYEAEHIALQRQVAIKELLPTKASEKHTIERFVQEARTAAGLDHPNIVKVIDLIPKGGRYYLVMEYLSGGSLRDRLKKGALDPVGVGQIGLDICRALEAVHNQGIIHRDIKPENILFQAGSQTAKLSDFGIAHVPKDVLGLSQSLTLTGFQPGTVIYMSPEQIRGDKVDGRSDLYTLGVVLYEALTGEFYLDFRQCETLYQVERAILEQTPRPLAGQYRQRWPQLVDTITRALCKEPEKRFLSAREMAFALQTQSMVAKSRQVVDAPSKAPATSSASREKPSLLERLMRSLDRNRRTQQP